MNVRQPRTDKLITMLLTKNITIKLKSSTNGLYFLQNYKGQSLMQTSKY